MEQADPWEQGRDLGRGGQADPWGWGQDNLGGLCCRDPKAGLGEPFHPDDPGQVPTSSSPPHLHEDTTHSTPGQGPEPRPIASWCVIGGLRVTSMVLNGRGGWQGVKRKPVLCD